MPWSSPERRVPKSTSSDLALGGIVVVSHFQAGALVAALDVEALIRLGAIEDALVAAGVLGDEIQCLNHLEPQLLALLVLGDRDVFDVACHAQVVNTGMSY